MTLTEQPGHRGDLDAIVERLTIGELARSTASIAERRDLLGEVADSAVINAGEWVRIATGETKRNVVTRPFRPFPRSVLHGELAINSKSPWFVSNRTAVTTGRRLTNSTAPPCWRELPALIASALQGWRMEQTS